VYDLIGDIHGHADELEEMLRRLGYRQERGAYRHPERTAVFVGDFIDRGPKIRETLRMVRAMLEAETALAVLGNHEWNAFCFHTEDPDSPAAYLREHSAKNRKQHKATVEQVPEAELAGHLAFLRTLPFHLSLPGANVVHACWDETELAVIDEALARHGSLSDAFLVEGSKEDSALYRAVEVTLKGKEMKLPAGVTFTDKDGHERHDARVRWYMSPEGQTLAGYTLPRFDGIPDLPLPEEIEVSARPYRLEAPPVFFGHYWLEESEPAPLAENVVCLDYSVAHQGFLCGYRQDGAVTAYSSKMVVVHANSSRGTYGG